MILTLLLFAIHIYGLGTITVWKVEAELTVNTQDDSSGFHRVELEEFDFVVCFTLAFLCEGNPQSTTP